MTMLDTCRVANHRPVKGLRIYEEDSLSLRAFATSARHPPRIDAKNEILLSILNHRQRGKHQTRFQRGDNHCNNRVLHFLDIDRILRPRGKRRLCCNGFFRVPNCLHNTHSRPLGLSCTQKFVTWVCHREQFSPTFNVSLFGIQEFEHGYVHRPV